MNQVNTHTSSSAVDPSPMFGSIWIALYCRLRDYRVNEASATESRTESKKTSQPGRS